MPEKPGEKLGDLLVKSGLIDELQLQSALGHQRRWGGKLGQCLIDLGFLTEAELLNFMSEKYKIPAVDLSKSRISDQAFAVLPESVAKKYSVVPVLIKEGPGKKKILTLAMSDPSDLKVADEVQFLTGLKVEPVLANESTIAKVLDHYGHYNPAEFAEARPRPDFARPLDLRKEHLKPLAPAAATKEGGEDFEAVLGQETRPEDMEEILDLEEAEQEGVDVISDEDVKVIRDEVIIVKAAAAKPKPKVSSSTERAPSRAPVQEKVEKIPEVESSGFAAVPDTATDKPVTEKTYINVPDLDLNPPEISEPDPQPKPAAAAPARPAAIDIPETGPEEKMEIRPAHEFLSWEQEEQKPAKEEPGQKPEAKAAAVEERDKKTELLSFEPETGHGQEQELTSLSHPQTAEDDFWQEHEQPSRPAAQKSAAEQADESEELLPFERPLAPPPPPPPASGPQDAQAGKVDFSRVEESAEAEPILSFEQPLPEQKAEPGQKGSAAGQESPMGESVGEISLEFAFQKINDLEGEIKQREFQLDELLNLMMKKELGEITAELFMQELNILKQDLEKQKRKKDK